MVFTDFSKIKDISFKYPELMSVDSKDNIIELFKSIQDNQEKIYNLRDEIARLERLIQKDNEKLDCIKPIIDITYETFEKEYHTNEVYVGFNMSSDINKSFH